MSIRTRPDLTLSFAQTHPNPRPQVSVGDTGLDFELCFFKDFNASVPIFYEPNGPVNGTVSAAAAASSSQPTSRPTAAPTDPTAASPIGTRVGTRKIEGYWALMDDQDEVRTSAPI